MSSISVIYTSVVKTPLGEMFAACTTKGICALCFYDKAHIDAHLKKLKKTFNSQIIESSNDYFNQLQQELDEYFMGEREYFEVPLQLLGTPFEVECYKALLSIKYGQTISYKQEAQKINNPKAYRAVANANSHNMIEILIPCHRVVQANGKLGGYSSGVDKKLFLLNLEQETLKSRS